MWSFASRPSEILTLRFEDFEDKDNQKSVFYYANKCSVKNELHHNGEGVYFQNIFNFFPKKKPPLRMIKGKFFWNFFWMNNYINQST